MNPVSNYHGYYRKIVNPENRYVSSFRKRRDRIERCERAQRQTGA